MPIKRTCPGAGCKNKGKGGRGGEMAGREVLERGRGVFRDDFVMIF